MSQRTINHSEQEKVDTSNGLCAGPKPVRSTETPQRDDVSCDVSSEKSSKRTLKDHQVDKPAPEGEQFEIINREDEELLTPAETHTSM